jgi:hypothetical protein
MATTMTDYTAEAAGDGRADLSGIEFFAFDFAALEDVGSESLEHGFLLKGEAQGLHVPEQTALTIAHGGEGRGYCFRAPMELGPGVEFVDVHSPHLCGDYSL